MSEIKDLALERKRTQIKESLAKLMATENIIVEHAPIHTAAFDLVNRKLLIPLWKDISEDVYTLLISHEVGHALYTPKDEWMKAVEDAKKENDGKENKNFKSTVNIVEDARIERMIQAKYPGTTRSFRAGYSELTFDRDFFGLVEKKKPIDQYGILDRINIHYKVGHFGYADVPFLDTEKKWLTEIDNAQTFQDVLDISKRLLEYAEEEAQQKDEQLNQDGGDLSGEEPLEMTQEELEQAIKDGKVKLDENGRPVKIKPSKDLSETQDHFDGKMKQNVDLTSEVKTLNIPQYDLKDVVIDYKKVYKQLSSHYSKNDIYRAKAQEYLNHFKANNKHIVNQLVSLFEMKKKAKLDSRAQIAKTGVLDTNKIHGYRYNEDIFRKVTNIPNGKSHGLVVMFDMSGSMSGNMAGTLAQMINIAMFCRKVNIPFEVYGFTDNTRNMYSYSQQYESKSVGEKKSGNIFLSNFNLRNYLSSRMSIYEYNDMLECLMCIIAYYSRGMGSRSGDYTQFSLPQCEQLGGTPLNESIITCMQLVPEFRAKYNLDIVHTIILTDGDGTSGITHYGTDEKTGDVKEEYINEGYAPEIFVRNKNSAKMWHLTKDSKKKTKRGYYQTRDITANLIDMYKEVTGSKMIGFYVCDKSLAHATIEHINYGGDKQEIDNLKRSFDDKQFAEVKKDGYDSYYIIPLGKDLLTQGSDIEFSESNGKDVVHRQFIKALSKKKNSRILLGRFIDNIA